MGSSKALLAQWIRTNWNDISPESIVRGFKMCCVSNSINGIKLYDLWEVDHEDNSSSGDGSFAVTS